MSLATRIPSQNIRKTRDGPTLRVYLVEGYLVNLIKAGNRLFHFFGFPSTNWDTVWQLWVTVRTVCDLGDRRKVQGPAWLCPVTGEKWPFLRTYRIKMLLILLLMPVPWVPPWQFGDLVGGFLSVNTARKLGRGPIAAVPQSGSLSLWFTEAISGQDKVKIMLIALRLCLFYCDSFMSALQSFAEVTWRGVETVNTKTDSRIQLSAT